MNDAQCLTTVMTLIHRALSVEATSVQKQIENHDVEESLQNFRIRFNAWATALMYHADIEDRWMTPQLTEFDLARTNEAEHTELANLSDYLCQYLQDQDQKTLESRVKAAAIALQQKQHDKLLESLEGVLEVMDAEIGKTKLVARTIRHLFLKIVALRTCQDDHFESEEALVLPEVEHRLDIKEKHSIVHRLLVDDDADDPNWFLGWIIERTDPSEHHILNSVSTRKE